MKNGKSAFVNMLLGRCVSPQEDVPCTSTVSAFKYAPESETALYSRALPFSVLDQRLMASASSNDQKDTSSSSSSPTPSSPTNQSSTYTPAPQWKLVTTLEKQQKSFAKFSEVVKSCLFLSDKDRQSDASLQEYRVFLDCPLLKVCLPLFVWFRWAFFGDHFFTGSLG
jgi:hypothetical protein